MATSSIHKRFILTSDSEVNQLVEIEKNNTEKPLKQIYSVNDLKVEEKKLIQKFFHSENY